MSVYIYIYQFFSLPSSKRGPKTELQVYKRGLGRALAGLHKGDHIEQPDTDPTRTGVQGSGAWRYNCLASPALKQSFDLRRNREMYCCSRFSRVARGQGKLEGRHVETGATPSHALHLLSSALRSVTRGGNLWLRGFAEGRHYFQTPDAARC